MVLPEFLIVGAPKCGTTSLAEALGRHPDLFIPERKEPSFFDMNWERGMGWFASYFQPAREGQLRGEATPEYFATPVAAERIARTNPACKLVVLARDPVKRAHSHYWFRRNTGAETRSFEQVIADETASPEAAAAGYLIRHGMYGANLDVYHRLFGPELVQVITFEDLIREPAKTIAACLAFLGVAPRELTLEQVNAARAPYSLAVSRAIQAFARYDGLPKRLLRRLVGEMPRKRVRAAIMQAVSRPERNPPLPDAIRDRLRAIYADDSARFQRVLGRASLWG